MVVMNKQTARQALRAAAKGQGVFVLGDTLPQAQAVMHDMMDVYPDYLTRPSLVRRVHGKHAIEFEGGGRIRFHSIRSWRTLRGCTIDRLYVPLGTAVDALGPLHPFLAVSGGTIMGYRS